jgi:hypothetical protein
MAGPPWLDELRARLERQGLPPDYVGRLLEELGDHFCDLQEEREGMDAEKLPTPETRMGEPGDLAQLIGTAYRRPCFSRRHPVVVFSLMPALLLLAIWTGLILLAYLLGTVLGEEAESAADGPAAQLVCYGVVWLPVALAAVLFCRVARRRRLDWRWPLLTAVTLAVFPGMTVRLTPSMLAIGFAPPAGGAALVQVLLPLAIGGWYGWRGYRLLGAS